MRKGPMTVAVTGAAGTVGAQVVEELLQRERVRVIRVDLPDAALPELPAGAAKHVEDRPGDLTDVAFARPALRGATHVIHTAAVRDLSLPFAALKPINVDTVGWLYEAARDEGVRAFVHVSTGAVYQRTRGVITEDTPLRADCDYEQTKLDAEAMVQQHARHGGPGWVVLRPAQVYGPRGKLLAGALFTLPPMLKLVSGGAAMFGARGGPRSNWVHTADVARAAVLVLERRDAYGETFNVCDDTPLTFGEIVNAAIAAYGFPITATVPIPPRWIGRLAVPVLESDPVLGAINAATAVLWKVIRQRHGLAEDLSPRIDRALGAFLIRDRVFSNARLRRLGWEPLHPDIRQALPGVLAWYQDRRWTPRYDAGSTAEPLDVGLELTETLSGTWRRSADLLDEDRSFVLTATVAIDRVRGLPRAPVARLQGTLFAEDLADGVPVAGSLELALLSRRRLVYDFGFAGRDGAPCRFHGHRQLDPLHPLDSLATLRGRLTAADGHEMGTATLTFDLLNDLLPMALSLRAIY
ncbi:MAG: NAD(P)-dependent oxidoreductase [Deltaproteobacteria bacterium]|nr:NAD(P)-dependent oxidoreductase [Deltaproteobacteria bacterium]